MNDALFVYGTLVDPATWRRISGRHDYGEPAWLDGWQARPVSGRPWPGLVETPGGRVAGLLYRGITPAMWRRLDAYEGAPYQRVRVWVRLSDGQCRAAWAYRWRPRYGSALAHGAWQLSAAKRGRRRRTMRLFLHTRESDR
ncbi:gamma-glutamylcyclotransferase family protein [endosymbiont of unidentified scaly snail isolate Monju]|uniref:gamma-glutamylcyclotransferase family protein n=1 Tax=endosymbiont of unidentified scaly snail isolate Monju TaxID=1248727 RepID=UPI0003891C74|nr:gamma-glutamylcyclotransferase family protein [endosymbiont of unidentified scaly snail isolate Monju]BAN68974.1 hypothetical protein EBS_1044 [endosymbiont of unidentified scaly snail isolate Monju]